MSGESLVTLKRHAGPKKEGVSFSPGLLDVAARSYLSPLA